MDQLINRIRFSHFISGVLFNQSGDPVCRRCKAFANTLRWTKEGISGLQSDGASEKGGIPAEVFKLISEARRKTDSIIVPEDAVGQKKAGNCKMPQGVCFVKASKSILEKL